MSDADVLTDVAAAFAVCPKPEHFTDFTHCCECAEHDEVLRSKDVNTLQIEQVGNPGWDPFCFSSAEGLLYYLPAMARLALDEPTEAHGWYADQLCFHLTYQGTSNRILRAASPRQRQAVAGLLRHIVETRGKLCEDTMRRKDLLTAAELWVSQ
jgi:hypothetical protein